VNPLVDQLVVDYFDDTEEVLKDVNVIMVFGENGSENEEIEECESQIE
jgi:hypothetical protein